jgi:hypothetical protein
MYIYIYSASTSCMHVFCACMYSIMFVCDICMAHLYTHMHECVCLGVSFHAPKAILCACMFVCMFTSKMYVTHTHTYRYAARRIFLNYSHTNFNLDMSYVCSQRKCIHTITVPLREQMLRKHLSQALTQIDTKYADGDGNGKVPSHLVNQKLGNRQEVLIGGGKSFGSWVMTELLAKAGLLPGTEELLADKVHRDPVMWARLQRSVLVWDVMERSGLLVCMYVSCMCVHVFVYASISRIG